VTFIAVQFILVTLIGVTWRAD